MRITNIKISRYRYIIIFVFLLTSISFVSSIPFRPAPTHLIVKQVNCLSCHGQEFTDLKSGIHIKSMNGVQNRALYDYIGLYANNSDLAYKDMVAPCYTCHATYQNYNLFGLTDPYVYSAGNFAYTLGNIAVTENINNAQYGTIISWPYPYSNITTIQSNSALDTITASLQVISIDSNSAITSDMKIVLSNYAGQQTGPTIFDYTQILKQGDTQTLTAPNVVGDYFNVSLLLEGAWNTSTLVLEISGTDKGTQSFVINAANPPVIIAVPKDVTGGDYLKTNGSFNAVRLDAIWNQWTNYPVNGNIASSDIIQTSTIGGGWINQSSCAAPDGMCHIIQQATSIGLSDGQNPDRTFYPHKMEIVTSKQCRICHLSSRLPPDGGNSAISNSAVSNSALALP